MSNALLRIGQVARLAGVSVEALRFYERSGLLAPAARTAAGYRVYDEEAVRRVAFVLGARQLGFTLKEAGELLDLRVGPGTSCAQVRARAERKLADVDARLAELRRIRRGLATLAARCNGGGPSGTCPLLDALDSPSPRRPRT